MNIKIILLIIFVIYCSKKNKKIEHLTNTKENYYDYVTFIPYNNMFIILGRFHRKRDYIKGFFVDQKFPDLINFTTLKSNPLSDSNKYNLYDSSSVSLFNLPLEYLINE